VATDSIKAVINTTITLLTDIQNSNSPITQQQQSSLDDQNNTLEKLIAKETTGIFGYDFYETSADLIEVITKLRLKIAKENGNNEAFEFSLNQIAKHIHNAVYQHPKLKDSPGRDNPLIDKVAEYKANPITIENLNNTMNQAQELMEQARSQSHEATQAALASNNETEKLLDEVNKEQLKSKGLVSNELRTRALDTSLANFAIQTAAVLASDESAATTIYLEDVINKTKEILEHINNQEDSDDTSH